MEHHNESLRPTPEQVRNFWRDVSDIYTGVISQMSTYLPDEDTNGFESFLDLSTLQDIAGFMYAARAAADTVAGAADRVIRNQGKSETTQRREAPREVPQEFVPRRTPARFTPVR